ncbi:hypothetical protein JST97_32245 [bacterium]|nr:hypothetical protein [bacterium]
MKRRASALLSALLIAVLLFVSGLALVFQMRADFQQRFQASRWAQARALAEAGLEDFRCKLERDPHFPPLQDIEQTVFEFEERVNPQGGYQVRSDVSLRKDPWNLILVRSTGYLGDMRRPILLVRLDGEFDVSVKVRSAPASDNPFSYQFRLTGP